MKQLIIILWKKVEGVLMGRYGEAEIQANEPKNTP
jgi:hypothetical protein